MTENTTELGQLIDCSEEEFREFCGDKDLGYIQGLCNLMTLTYNQVQDYKNDLVKLLASTPDSERPEEGKSTLEGLYSKLLRIEQRVFILRDIIKQRSL